MDNGPLFNTLEGALRVASYPIAWLEAKITNAGTRKLAIEGFQVVCLIVALLLAFCTPYWWPMAAWAGLRLLDIAHVHIKLFGAGGVPSSAPRSVVFLLIHYTEVVLLCAVLYMFLQTFLPDGCYVFQRAPDGPALLTNVQAVFFSFTTASTIGFGDISPLHSAPLRFVAWVYLITWFKAMLVIFLTVVEVSRIMSARR